MREFNDIEKLFYSDVREKKKTASGIHSRTGKRGYVGKMRFSYDLMNRKEKYNYRRSGKIMTTNLFDEILPYEEFKELETHEQRNRLAYWRQKYTNKEILTGMKIYQKILYDLVKELDLPNLRRANNTGKRAAKAKTKQPEAITAVAAINPEPVQEIIFNGLNLVYNGTYTAEQLQRQLQKFITLLEDEPDQFYIELKITQKV